MVIENFPQVRELSSAEKLIYVSELWDDIAEHPSEVPVPREVLAELDKRMEHFRQNPDQFTSWEAIQEKVLGHQL